MIQKPVNNVLLFDYVHTRNTIETEKPTNKEECSTYRRHGSSLCTKLKKKQRKRTGSYEIVEECLKMRYSKTTRYAIHYVPQTS